MLYQLNIISTDRLRGYITGHYRTKIKGAVCIRLEPIIFANGSTELTQILTFEPDDLICYYQCSRCTKCAAFPFEGPRK